MFSIDKQIEIFNTEHWYVILRSNKSLSSLFGFTQTYSLSQYYTITIKLKLSKKAPAKDAHF